MKKHPKRIDNEWFYDTWYEVFVSTENYGSQTVVTCPTLTEAKAVKSELLKSKKYKRGELYIDRWGCLNESSHPIQIGVTK